MFECVINIAEGRNHALLDALSAAAGSSLRDRHADTFHHRSVFTLVDDADSLVHDIHRFITAAFERLSLVGHVGVHPRIGVVDVVPFVPLDGDFDAAVVLRDDTARWIARTFDVPVFLYGPGGPTLPEIRRGAFTTLAPDFGPPVTHPRWGACAVGARDVLIAWNIELAGTPLVRARELAARLRSSSVRTLGLATGDTVQVSCNLIDWRATPPSAVYDHLADALGPGEEIVRCELVGLIPDALLQREDPSRWAQLGLSPSTTIGSRL